MFQKSSPKPFFVYPHLFSQILCWISPTSVFFMWWSQHCENWPPCIIAFLVPSDILFLDLKILHGLPIRSRWKAVQELSSGVCLKASSSSGGVPSCIQRGSSFHLSRKFWFWTACVTLSSLNHLAYFGLETLVCNAVYSYLCVWGLCGSSWNRSCHTAKDVTTYFCFLGE